MGSALRWRPVHGCLFWKHKVAIFQPSRSISNMGSSLWVSTSHLILTRMWRWEWSGWSLDVESRQVLPNPNLLDWKLLFALEECFYRMASTRHGKWHLRHRSL